MASEGRRELKARRMLGHRERKLRVTLILGDGVLAGFSFATAACTVGLLRGLGDLSELVRSDAVYSAAAVTAVVSPFALAACRNYEGVRWRTLRQLLVPLPKGTAIGALALLAIGLAFRSQSLSGSVVAAYAAIHLVTLATYRTLLLSLRRALGNGGYHSGTFVVIGSGPHARDFAARIEAAPWVLRNRGFLDDEPAPVDLAALGERYLGRTKKLVELLRNEVVDEVIIVLPPWRFAEQSSLETIQLCAAVGVDVTIVSDLPETQTAKLTFHRLLGVPGVTLSSAHPRPLWASALKRTIDVVGAIIGLGITLPFWPLTALAIKLESPGPVFFVQRRCGLRGRTFPFCKFRTMRVDAEERFADVAKYNEVSGPVFKMKNDPRLTRVGRFLRKYSIDEIPQFLNVLVGHMSLVGPRPPIPGEVTLYELEHRRRLSVRPGLTCLWQVSGRSLIPFEDWVRLDLQYIDGWSLLLDLRILLRTLPAVLKADGAS
jgi:exopolysaccharide biosynthesis polyprenyl glycosylphosphotransferase